MSFSRQEMRLFLVHQGSMLMYPFRVCITCFLSLFLYLILILSWKDVSLIYCQIFQQLSNTTTQVLPSSHSIAEAEDISLKEITFESRSEEGDPSADDEASLLASFSNLSKDVPALSPQPPNGENCQHLAGT